MKTIAVLTSGGDAPGMNAAIRAVVKTALFNGIRVLGVERGYNGLINGEMKELTLESVRDIIHKGGTVLKTARCDEFKEVKYREKALNVLKVFGVDGLVVIGGDGSFTGALKLSEMGFNAIGIPGTIDNDLAYTDYTIGFDTAQNTVLDSISKIRDTSASHDRVSIVEVMGRHCGDIALYTGIAGGADDIIVPEKEYDMNEICKRLIKAKNRGKCNSIIMLAEGVGNSSDMRKIIEDTVGAETRVTVLGHIQRGGNPSAYDRILASRMGVKAVELLIEGKTRQVVGIKENRLFGMDIVEALKMKHEYDGELDRVAKILSMHCEE